MAYSDRIPCGSRSIAVRRPQAREGHDTPIEITIADDRGGRFMRMTLFIQQARALADLLSREIAALERGDDDGDDEHTTTARTAPEKRKHGVPRGSAQPR